MVTLTVTGMTCGGCAATVEKLIKREDAGAKVSVDLATGRVEADTRAPAEALVKAIEAAGFGATAG
jgi:copper chaperone CopZ